MRVLITGSEGYIGALLRDVLLERGHEVAGLDAGYFNSCDFHTAPTPIPVVQRDLREAARDDFEGFDAVCHLAALSNDPLGSLNPQLTHDVNTRATLRVAKLAKEAGVRRFVFSSSCSLYGAGAAQGLTEEAPFNPQTPYARSKVDVEEGLRELADDSFSPTYLRNATVYGLSPRLRFDLVLNNLCGWAFTRGKIVLTSDGSPWRPLVHVRDVCEVFACCVDAPRGAVHDEAFNVGSTGDNYQIRTIAEHVSAIFEGCEIELGTSDGDTRTYNVDFTKLTAKLPGFTGVQYGIDDAIREFRDVFAEMTLADDQFQGRLYTRLKQINYLRQAGLLDDELRWSAV